MNFRVIVVTILMLLVGQKYTYADGITKPVITNVYIFRHGRVTKDGDYLVLKKESETEIRNSAEEISCDSYTSRDYKIFYLVKKREEKESQRFKQTADQIDAGLKNRKSCNFNREIDKQPIFVTDPSEPNSADLKDVWNKIKTEEPPEEPNSSNSDENLKNYNKIFVLSAEVIKALLRPNIDQCLPIDAPCFMENWQAVNDVIESSRYNHNKYYGRGSRYQRSTDFLYAMILHLQLHRITKPYNSISPVGIEKITICSKPTDHPESPLDCPSEFNNQ